MVKNANIMILDGLPITGTILFNTLFDGLLLFIGESFPFLAFVGMRHCDWRGNRRMSNKRIQWHDRGDVRVLTRVE